MVIVLLLLVVLVVSVAALAHTLFHDGYGSRPAPRSHLDPFDPSR